MRELDSRLLLAAIAAERGIAAVIGQQWLLTENFRYLPPGLVVFKGNNTIQHGYMKIARRHGHAVASIEEEALGVAKASQILRLYDPGVDQTCQLFLAQGEFHRRALIEHFPSIADRVVVVGNPRMDFLRPEFLKLVRAERDAIRNRYGAFVLVNTNIADINSALGDALASYDMCVRTRYITAGDPVGEQDFRELLAWEHANAREVAQLVQSLRTARPETTIVIRPHPSERIATWQDAFAGVEGVHVVADGPHLPWTLACDVLVHTGCTTGMEAFVAGQTAISLCPGSYQWHDCMVSNHVNRTFASHRDAANYLVEHLIDKRDRCENYTDYERALNDHVAATRGQLAAERMVDALQKLIPKNNAISFLPIKTQVGFKATRQGSARQAVKLDISLENARSHLANIGQALDRFHGAPVIELGHAIFQVGSAV